MEEYDDMPPPNEFLRLLASSSKDLDNLVGDITAATRLFNLNRESRINLFATYSDGTKKFFLADPNDPHRNLLDGLHSLGELGEYVANLDQDWHMSIRDTRTGYWLHDNYSGPKIRLFKDSNILIDGKARADLAYLGLSPAIIDDVLTLVRYESQPGGLKKRFNGNIPEMMARGQASLEKRCRGLNPEVKAELTRLYDIFHSEFEKEVNAIMGYADARKGADLRGIAESFVASKRRHYPMDYAKTVRKVIEKCNEGDRNNFIVDRVLTAASFGFNFVEERDRAVAISNDCDLINMFDFFYQQVLPTYMAETTLEAMKKDRAFMSLPGVRERTVAKAREQIEWARETFDDRLTLGVLYVPAEKRFYVKEVAAPLREYFNKVKLYRIGKIQLISKMVITGKGAEETVQKLMQEEAAALMD